MDAASRRFVRERAGERCEYCRLHQTNSELSHHIEHVIAPSTGTVAPLFHPRRDRWSDHFVFRSGYLDGLTPSGRATVEVLNLNDARRLELRRELLRLGELI